MNEEAETFNFKYHHFDVPINWDDELSKTLQITIREVLDQKDSSKPPILFFQGGPGFGCRFPDSQQWIKELQKKFRVFLLDQRGTGLSTPIDLQTISEIDDISHDSAINFLQLFRSDSIAKDAEYIRSQLFNDSDFYTFGQSFGGWCTFSYLSQFPNRTSGSFITGGFPPIDSNASQVYESLIPQINNATQNFFNMYSETEKQLKYLMHNLDSDSLYELAMQGLLIGFSDEHSNLRSKIEQLYYEMTQNSRISLRSKNMLKDAMGLIDNPLYLFLHESLYCEKESSNWAGENVFADKYKRPSNDDVLNFFFAETILHKYFEYPELKPFLPLMDKIMAFDQWHKQFDLEGLTTSETPVVGYIFNNDAYVSKEFSIKAASKLNNCRTIFSDYDHHAMKTHSEEVIRQFLN